MKTKLTLILISLSLAACGGGSGSYQSTGADNDLAEPIDQQNQQVGAGDVTSPAEPNISPFLPPLESDDPAQPADPSMPDTVNSPEIPSLPDGVISDAGPVLTGSLAANAASKTRSNLTSKVNYFSTAVEEQQIEDYELY